VSPLDPSRIPAELTAGPAWCVWREEVRNGKPTKVPYNPMGGPFKSNDSATWATLADAVAAFEDGGYNGIGRAITGDLVGVDIDWKHCNPATPPAWLGRVLTILDSWSETSPSGLGAHVWLRGKWNGHARVTHFPDGSQVEVYDASSPRYFTMTGKVMLTSPETIRSGPEAQAALDQLAEELAKVVTAPRKPAGNGRTHHEDELEGAPEGARRAALTSRAGRLRALGVSLGEARAILLEVGRRCAPPVPDEDVQGILGWAWSKPAGGRPETTEEGDETPGTPYPAPAGRAAFYGPAGELVDAIAPHTEADPVAILVQLLVGWGSLVGRCAYYGVEADRHYTNLFAAIVGASAKGRKGTAWGHVKAVLAAMDETWAKERVKGGLSSGEGLIWKVRDAIERTDPVKQKGRVIDTETYVADPGESDKRLFVLEPELAETLRVMARDGSILSAIIRQAWDTGDLQVLTKSSPAKATDAHVSLAAHITAIELRRYLDRTEMGNGFGNRILWVCARRSQLLPFGGDFTEDAKASIAKATVRLREATEQARQGGDRCVSWSDAGAKLWAGVYGELSAGRPGLFGAMTSRAEAQVCRLALLYALLDCSRAIDQPHLEAALELWRYSAESVRHIFGDSIGDPLADELLTLLRRAGADGVTRTEIRDAFSKNKSAEELERALGALADLGLAVSRPEPTKGRPAERWFPIRGYDQNDGSDRRSRPSSFMSFRSYSQDQERSPGGDG